MRSVAAAGIVLIYSALLSVGGLVGKVLAPTMVEWIPQLSPHRDIVWLIPMAVTLVMATRIVRRTYPTKDEEAASWAVS